MATSTFDRKIKLDKNAVKKLIILENNSLPIEPLNQRMIDRERFEEGDKLLNRVLFC